MFTPIDPAIKEKVIAAHLAGQGRNQIARQLNKQGLKISNQSVSNIINRDKRQHDQLLQSHTSVNEKLLQSHTNINNINSPPSGPQPEANSMNSATPINIVGSSSLHGDEIASDYFIR